MRDPLVVLQEKHPRVSRVVQCFIPGYLLSGVLSLLGVGVPWRVGIMVAGFILTWIATRPQASSEVEASGSAGDNDPGMRWEPAGGGS